MKSLNKYIIKNILIAAVSGISFGMVSCSKYTELSPQIALSESTAFTDSAKIELVANGMYWQAAVGTYSGSTGRGYPFGAAAIEQDEMRGEDMVNLQAFYLITYTATYTTTSANNVNMWEQLYALVNQANVLINGVEEAQASGIISEALANQYAAEGRFMRALSYHELLIHFSRPYVDNSGSNLGVPYHSEPTNSTTAVAEGIATDRSTVADTYSKILEDLDFAEENLPTTQTNGAARPSKAAAIALKTRIKLHMQDWAGVITEGTKLGTAVTGTTSFSSPIGSYKLESDPATPFTSYSSNSESIFSIANSATANGGVNGALPNMFGPSSTGARGLVVTSPNLYNASYWVTGDKRRTELQYTQASNGYVFNNKYTEVTTHADWAPIIRYAEVLLNVAEAYSRTNNSTQAFALLNAVRNRSVPTASQFTSVPTDLTLAILNERRIEFAGEGRRWPDITRLSKDATYGLTGIPAKIASTQIAKAAYDIVNRPVITPSVAAFPYSSYLYLWPIPTSEITSNPTLAAQQNPGY